MHSFLSPSSAERWMECPGSTKLEQLFPNRTSDYADEGTLAHSLGELLLKKQFKLVNNYTYNKDFEQIKTSRFYNEEMHEYCEDYVAYVMENYHDAGDDAVIKFETKVNLDEWVPEGFGTVDTQIASSRILKIIDFKYGKGILVSAELNKQLMLYGLGVLREHDLVYNIEFIELHIFQPRLNNISSYTIPVKALNQWANRELIPKARKAFDGIPEFKAGKHCQFCKAKQNCKTLAEYNLEIARNQFQIGSDEEELELLDLKEVQFLTDDQIAVIVLRTNEFKKWLTAVENYALTEAVVNTKKWPGLKLVEGRSNRKISDENIALNKLIESGFDKKDITKTSLIGITALEKLLGAKNFSSVLGSLIFKPVGAPTLVQASDKRNALNSLDKAIEEFKILDLERSELL